ncbi:MAG: radical SAM protein [Phycisphaerales bacterium]
MSRFPPSSSGDALHRLVSDHSRQWKSFTYVYPVISRRSAGLSVGINLNIDTACNFDCVYCQVDRPRKLDSAGLAGAIHRPRSGDVDLDQLAAELDRMLSVVADGDIWRDAQFRDTPQSHQRLNDIAFSGDGEPTACPQFPAAVQTAIDLRLKYGLSDAKIVLITNATLLNRPQVEQTLQLLDANRGEVWAKLDAGTEAYFRKIDRPRSASITLEGICDNIALAGRARPLVIQSLFMRWAGEPTPPEELDAYIERVIGLTSRGCRIARVQFYTIVRRTAEPLASPLNAAQLNALAERFRLRLPDIELSVYT